MKRSRKALSGAVTALILVIASVILTLVVVGFAFGLIGAFSTQPRISVVNAYVQNGELYVILQNTGNAPGAITAYIINGKGPTTTNIPVPVGTTTIAIPLKGISELYPGQLVSFTLITSNGVTIFGTAIVES